MEDDMERYKLIHVLLSEEDVRVLMESLWHACQRGDIPDEDRERARVLRASLGEKFNAH
jgi:hypothetical protein